MIGVVGSAFGPLAMRGMALSIAQDRRLQRNTRDHEIARDCRWTPFSWQCDTRRPLVPALSFSFVFGHSGQCSLSSICKRPRLVANYESIHSFTILSPQLVTCKPFLRPSHNLLHYLSPCQAMSSSFDCSTASVHSLDMRISHT